jgi:hypothetical protein
MRPDDSLPPARRFPVPVLLAAAIGLASLTGCYTQLATRGYYNHPDSYYSSGRGAETPSDSLLPDSALTARAEGDTLAPGREGAPTVIVNNYYDPEPHYRGYAHWEWAFPSLSYGYYSSRYYHYSRPYWWDDPWRDRRQWHGRRHDRPHVIHPPAPSGPYKSDKRLYNPPPSYPEVRKGRRAPEPVSVPAEPAPEAAPKQGGDGGGSSTPAGTGDSGEAKPSGNRSSGDDGYRSLKKGRRR